MGEHNRQSDQVPVKKYYTKYKDNKNQQRKSILLILLMAVFVFIAAVAAYKVVQALSGYKQSSDYYAELSDYIDVPAVKPASLSMSNESPSEPELPQEGGIPVVDFEALQKINPDVVGWIYSEGTKISYPVVQTNNNEYYLDRLFNKKYNRSGCLFVDAGNQPGLEDYNTVIYGHNMLNGSMFSSLENYRKQQYYDSHPEMYYITPSQTYKLELFAGYYATEEANAWTLRFSSPSVYNNWLQNSAAKSGFKSDVALDENVRVLTLSTCVNNVDEDKWFIVVGKLVPE